MVASRSRRAFCLGLCASALARPVFSREGAVPRIAALEHRIVETILALGIAPVAMQDPFNYRRWTVEPALPGSVLDVGTEPEPNMEYLAELRPDLILIPEERQDLARLAAIAPLERLRMTPGGGVSEYDHFIHMTRAAGTLLDREREARQVADGVEAEVDRTGRLLSPLGGKPLYLATLVDERHVWVYGRANLFQTVLDRAGLTNSWNRDSLFEAVGIERLAERPDASLIYIQNNQPGLPAGLDDSPLWHALHFVREGRVHGIPSVTPFGALPTAGRFARLLTGALATVASSDG